MFPDPHHRLTHRTMETVPPRIVMKVLHPERIFMELALPLFVEIVILNVRRDTVVFGELAVLLAAIAGIGDALRRV